MQVPLEISRTDYTAALAVFGEAVGLDPALTTLPLVLDSDGIHFSVIVTNDDGGKILTQLHGYGAGNLGSILTATGKIEVV